MKKHSRAIQSKPATAFQQDKAPPPHLPLFGRFSDLSANTLCEFDMAHPEG